MADEISQTDPEIGIKELTSQMDELISQYEKVIIAFQIAVEIQVKGIRGSSVFEENE